MGNMGRHQSTLLRARRKCLVQCDRHICACSTLKPHNGVRTCRQERLSDRACGITSRAPGEKSPDTFRHPASAFYKSFVDVERKMTQRKITCPGSFLARVGVSISVDLRAPVL